MDRFIGKRYKLISSDNFEEYLKFISKYFVNIFIVFVSPINYHSFTKHNVKLINPRYLYKGNSSTFTSIVTIEMNEMDQFIGKEYKLKSSENYEDYLLYIDIGMFSRKTAISVTPTACLERNEDGSYTFIMSTTFRTTKTTFDIDEEFIEERADGVKVKSVVIIDGDCMIQTQTEDNGRKSTHVRKFTPETLTVTTTAEGWDGKCVRVYEIVD